jgi:hypothetical protein
MAARKPKVHGTIIECKVGDEVPIRVETSEAPDKVWASVWGLCKPASGTRHQRFQLYNGFLGANDTLFFFRPIHRGEHHVVIVTALPGTLPAPVYPNPTTVDAFSYHIVSVKAT